MYQCRCICLVIVLLWGCSGNNTTPTEKRTDTIEQSVTKSATDGNDILTRFDQVKKALEEWNTAINQKDMQKLNELYADEVQYYKDKTSKTACIEKKKNWLDKHENYTQEITNAEIYYMEPDTMITMVIVDFDKICREDGKSSEVRSSMRFKKIGGQWKIIKETDIQTELLMAKPSGNLPNGESQFYLGYLQDARDIPEFSAEVVPYSFTMQLSINGNKITGALHLYSGTMRTTSSYLISEGKVEDGILNITTHYNENAEYSLEDYPFDAYANEADELHFKIINGNELFGLDEHLGYLYGKSMWLEKQ